MSARWRGLRPTRVRSSLPSDPSAPGSPSDLGGPVFTQAQLVKLVAEFSGPLNMTFLFYTCPTLTI